MTKDTQTIGTNTKQEKQMLWMEQKRIVTVCHEAPPGMFRSSKNFNADSLLAMFKEKLLTTSILQNISSMKHQRGSSC